MKILSLDTSSKNAIVVITEDKEKIIELNNEEEKTHSQKLMPMIEEAFQTSNLTLEDIGLIVCCLGPGSFTGVRIGIATAKAFADSKNIPTTGVNSLEVLAYQLNTEGHICSFIDAGHGNVYAGYFKIEKDKNSNLQTIQEDLRFLNLTTENITSFIEKYVKDKKQTIHFIGDATINYQEIFEKLKNQYTIKIENPNTPLGITIAKIGYTKYKNGKLGNSSILSPIYLRKSQAELTLEEKNRGK